MESTTTRKARPVCTMSDVRRRRRLAVRLNKQGMSQTAIAEKLGVTNSTVSKYVHKRYKLSPKKRARSGKTITKLPAPPKESNDVRTLAQLVLESSLPNKTALEVVSSLLK